MVPPLRVQKGCIVKHEQKYVEIVNVKSNPIGSHFEYKLVQDPSIKGKIKSRSYDELELVDSEFLVEVEKINEDVIVTTNNRHERIEVPVSLIDEEMSKKLKIGSKIAILMDNDVFVKLTLKSSHPKWQ
jgi:hypothetical protein